MTKDLPLPEEQLKNFVPLQRRGNQDDIGGLILYLASKVRLDHLRSDEKEIGH